MIQKSTGLKYEPSSEQVTYKLSGFVSWADFLDCDPVAPEEEDVKPAARERRNLQVNPQP